MKKKIAAILVSCSIISVLLIGCVNSTVKSTTASSGPTAAIAASSSETLGEGATAEQINAFITAPSKNPDKIVLRYTSTTADLDTQAYMKGFREFMKYLKTELGDRIEIKYLLNATMGSSADAILGGLQNRTIEMSDWPLTSYAEFTNAFTPLDVPYLVTTLDDMHALLSGEAGEYMKQKCLDDTGLRVIFYSVLGSREMTNSVRPIKSVADMKGLKFRVQPNKLHMLGIEAMGATATNIAFAELFTALQQGTVDGQENPADTIYNMQFYDVQKYMSTTDHIITGGSLVMNNDFFEELDPEMQEVFIAAGEHASDYVMDELKASLDEVYKNLEKKIEITYLTDEERKEFQAAAQKAWPQMREVIGAEYFDKVIELAGVGF